MKAIIVYYSKDGVTQKLAEKIREDLQCDILKVEPAKKYGNFAGTVLRLAGEMATNTHETAKTPIPNLEEYDVVLLGFPVWAGDMPLFYADFVEACDLDGKYVIPFATSGGTSVKQAAVHIRKLCPDARVGMLFDQNRKKKDDYALWIGKLQGLLCH